LKPYRDAYYSCAIADPSAFQQFLANIALHRVIFESKDKVLIDDAAVTYHGRAIKLANERITNSAVGMSDGMIVTVLLMATYNVCKLLSITIS
jgi:hypothetical protein